ncbi:hypothetical protein B0H14DRAFT_547428 [Mycena olivaceomarginata]|nr:hypothetical protein B0H14DRAFT_547428 [Mycena olivaceomarginata]
MRTTPKVPYSSRSRLRRRSATSSPSTRRPASNRPPPGSPMQSTSRSTPLWSVHLALDRSLSTVTSALYPSSLASVQSSSSCWSVSFCSSKPLSGRQHRSSSSLCINSTPHARLPKARRPILRASSSLRMSLQQTSRMCTTSLSSSTLSLAQELSMSPLSSRRTTWLPPPPPSRSLQQLSWTSAMSPHRWLTSPPPMDLFPSQPSYWWQRTSNVASTYQRSRTFATYPLKYSFLRIPDVPSSTDSTPVVTVAPVENAERGSRPDRERVCTEVEAMSLRISERTRTRTAPGHPLLPVSMTVPGAAVPPVLPLPPMPVVQRPAPAPVSSCSSSPASASSLVVPLYSPSTSRTNTTRLDVPGTILYQTRAPTRTSSNSVIYSTGPSPPSVQHRPQLTPQPTRRASKVVYHGRSDIPSRAAPLYLPPVSLRQQNLPMGTNYQLLAAQAQYPRHFHHNPHFRSQLMHSIPTPAMLNAARSVRGRRPSRRPPALPTRPPVTTIRASIRHSSILTSPNRIFLLAGSPVVGYHGPGPEKQTCFFGPARRVSGAEVLR